MVKLKHKILIITAVWQRHDLTKVVLDYYGRMAASSDGRISLLAVGSEGEVSRKMCESRGWAYTEFKNRPLSHKWSALVKEARKMDFDFLVIAGSDDLLSRSLIEYYDRVYSADADYMLGLKDLYFYMMSSEESWHFHGYDVLKTIGAGRCLSRKVLDMCGWRPWYIYVINRGLDTHCSRYLARCGVGERAVLMGQAAGVGIDIKHYDIAITKEDRIIAKSTPSMNILEQWFPKEYEAVCEMMDKEALRCV
jgi:hypothetical protein